MVKYKVVIKLWRCGAVDMGLFSVFAGGRYRLEYTHGRITVAIPKSVGIMVFNKKSQAQRFMECCNITTYATILRVKPIGKGTRPTKISTFSGANRIHEFYNYSHGMLNSHIKNPPTGTMCYPKVVVLD